MAEIAFKTLGMKATKQLERIVANIFSIFFWLCDNSKDFKATVDGLPLNKKTHDIPYGFYPLVQILPNNPASFSEDFCTLVNLCRELWIIYDMFPVILKSNDEIEDHPMVARYEPIVSSYKIKGETIKLTNQNSPSINCVLAWNAVGHAKRMWFDEIKIDDLNDLKPSDNGLSGLFEGIRGQTPSIIKYTSKSGRKALLVSIPQYFDPSIFLKKYRAIIRKQHADFYQIQFKGRTPSKDQKAGRIWKALEDKYGHWEYKEKLTNDRMAREVSEILKKQKVEHASFQNIRRNYKFLLKKFREAKNR